MIHLFVDGLTVVDCSYLHPDRGIVGESWLADITLGGDLDGEGVVFDFSYAKKAIKGKIDDTADHSLIVPLKDPKLSIEQQEDMTSLEYTDSKGRFYRYLCPTQGLCLIDTDVITEATVEQYLKGELKSVVPENVQDIGINLRPEKIEGAFYHYSHGLKKHYGNCQRMVHGHRSTIEIFIDDKKQHELEQKWAEAWQDIYLGTAEDLSQKIMIANKPYLEFSYDGNQGHFELIISEGQCDIFETDTTVELIAEHLFNETKKDFPNNTVKVRAFEGIEKGAMRVG
jgi:6-pyruvoyl-tetrahydropterin synthase